MRALGPARPARADTCRGISSNFCQPRAGFHTEFAIAFDRTRFVMQCSKLIVRSLGVNQCDPSSASCGLGPAVLPVLFSRSCFVIHCSFSLPFQGTGDGSSISLVRDLLRIRA